VAWTVQLLEEALDVVIVLPGSHSRKKRLNDKGLPFRVSLVINQTEAQQPVDGSLEGIPGSPGLFFYQDGQIVVDGEGGSHIMMFVFKAS